MEVILSHTEFRSSNNLVDYRTCSVGNLQIPIGDKRYSQIIEAKKFTMVIDNPRAGYTNYKYCVRFIDCILCGYGYQNNGFEHIQINYWASERISNEERRYIFTQNILENELNTLTLTK